MVNKNFQQMKQGISANTTYKGDKAEISALRRVHHAYYMAEPNSEIVKRMENDEIAISTNSKTGNLVLNVNMTTAWACKECRDGKCSVQRPIIDNNGDKHGKIRCYALSTENRLKDKMENSLWNYIMFHELEAEEIAKQIVAKCGNKVKHIRFNEMGCFATPYLAKKAMAIAEILKGEGIHCYSYTSDKEMFDLINGSDITINWSNGEYNGELKTTRSIYPSRKNAEMVLNDENKVFCLGDCSNCPYCKDEQDFRQIIFFMHGGGIKVKAEDVFTKEELNHMKEVRKTENEAYLERIG